MTQAPQPGMTAARYHMVRRLPLDQAWQQPFIQVRREDLHASLRRLGQYLPTATTGAEADMIYDPDVALPMSAGPHPGTVYAPAPGFAAHLVTALQLQSADRVLLVGAADGYLAALLCHRVGADRVLVVDHDAALLERTGTALREAGFAPELRCRGPEAVADIAPAPTHLLCAHPRERIPPAWLRVVRLAGVIVAAVSLKQHGGPAVRLVTDGPATASGLFLPGDAPALPPGEHRDQPAEDIGLTVTASPPGAIHATHRLWWPTPDTEITTY